MNATDLLQKMGGRWDHSDGEVGFRPADSRNGKTVGTDGRDSVWIRRGSGTGETGPLAEHQGEGGGEGGGFSPFPAGVLEITETARGSNRSSI